MTREQIAARLQIADKWLEQAQADAFPRRALIEARNDLAKAIAALAAPVAADRLTPERWHQLRLYVEMAGSFHDEDCPSDDTCECSAKPMHDAVNALCALPEPPARAVAAEPPSLVALHALCMEKYTEWQNAINVPKSNVRIRRLEAEFLEARNNLLAWTPAQAEPAAPEWKPRYNRETAHLTFNGGHHEDCCRAAFHQGMDTVFNLIEDDALLAATLAQGD